MGRPHCGAIRGVLPSYREEVIKQFIEWQEKGCFYQENPTGRKALADFIHNIGLLLSKDKKPLSCKTIEQEIGEIYRTLHKNEIKEKKSLKSRKTKKKMYKN